MPKRLKIRSVGRNQTQGVLVVDFGDNIQLHISASKNGELEVELEIETNTIHRLGIRPSSDKSFTIVVEEP